MSSRLPRDIESMSTDKLVELHEAISQELSDRDPSWYEQVMEDPVAYKERVMNDTPFDSDDDYIDHLWNCVDSDPDFFERPEPRCG